MASRTTDRTLALNGPDALLDGRAARTACACSVGIDSLASRFGGR
jgi:hypothetical protein